MVVKPRSKNRSTSTQHMYIATLLAKPLEASTKRSRRFNETHRSNVGPNLLLAFGHPVTTCCDILGIENRTSAHALAQHCCTNLAKRAQHHATSTTVACEATTPNMSKHVATRRNRVAKRAQHVAPNNVAICCVEMLRSFGAVKGLAKLGNIVAETLFLVMFLGWQNQREAKCFCLHILFHKL